MDCTAWVDNLGSKEVERLLHKIGHALSFELVSNIGVWWYETRWADGKCLETLEAVRFPESCGGLCDSAFLKPSRLLCAVLQTRIFRVNVHRDDKRRWQESHFVLNPVFNVKSLEELEIALDLLLGEGEGEATENGH